MQSKQKVPYLLSNARAHTHTRTHLRAHTHTHTCARTLTLSPAHKHVRVHPHIYRERERESICMTRKSRFNCNVMKICQTLLISSLNALVQSAGFSLKTQPRLLLLRVSSHGLTTATVSSWVHLILSSKGSRKFKTLLQNLFSWHAVTTTQHLSWKNCTGFPFQNVLSIKSLVCVLVL